MFEYIKTVSYYYTALANPDIQLVEPPTAIFIISQSAIGGMALSLAYGLQIQHQTEKDPFIQLAETAVKSISAAASFGAFFVDVIPILKHVPEFVPGAGFQKKARVWRKIQEDFRNVPYESSIEAIVRFFFFTIFFFGDACMHVYIFTICADLFFFFWGLSNFKKASGKARPSFTSISLADIDENRDINRQREVIKDTSAMVFAGMNSLPYC